MKKLTAALILIVLVTPVAFPGDLIFSNGFEPPRTCWPGGEPVGELDLCFDMPYDVTPTLEMDTVEAATEISRADLIIGMDTTGSMGGEIDNLKSAIPAIIDEFLNRSPDGAVSVAGYDDYPYEPYGSLDQGDLAFYLLHRSMTASTPAGKASITNAVNALTTHFGSDTPESGWEMVYQVATGAGSGVGVYAVPPFDPATAPPVPIPEGEETGDIGGVGIREASMPILVWITDAPSHTGVDYAGSIPGVTPATSNQALNSIRNIGGRIIGVMSNEAARADLTQGVTQTNAVVTPDAWGMESRPAGCEILECCTGNDGTGVAPVVGNCPLVYEILADGSGLGSAIVDGIEQLLTSITHEISANLVDDPSDAINTIAAFVERLEADNSLPEPCSQGLTVLDTNGDATPDTFVGVEPGSVVCFNVVVKTNQMVPPAGEAQYFSADLQIIADGISVLESRSVHFRVPPL